MICNIWQCPINKSAVVKETTRGKKVAFANTRRPIDVQDMHDSVEQWGFGFYQCCSELFFFVMVSTIEIRMTVGCSLKTLVVLGMYLWHCLGSP